MMNAKSDNTEDRDSGGVWGLYASGVGPWGLRGTCIRTSES